MEVNSSKPKIAFFSEMGFAGKTARTHKNMRTEFAWFVALDADHIPIARIPEVSNQYDLGILIIPKNVQGYLDTNIVAQMRAICKKVAFMQEGPSWYFQDLPLRQSMWFFNQMLAVDIVFAHNDIDKRYYEGLLNKPVYINPTLMIEDLVAGIPNIDRAGVIIGGNLGRWYGGIDSYITALEFQESISAPQMGRMDKEELAINEIKHLPYLEWYDWINELNKFKYAVHLNPNTIAGTFNLNCAYLGIPCIGNVNSNTQRLCFPDLSIEPSDIKKGRELARKLKEDKDFYTSTSEKAIKLYNKHFSEQVYKTYWTSNKFFISL